MTLPVHYSFECQIYVLPSEMFNSGDYYTKSENFQVSVRLSLRLLSLSVCACLSALSVCVSVFLSAFRATFNNSFVFLLFFPSSFQSKETQALSLKFSDDQRDCVTRHATSVPDLPCCTHGFFGIEQGSSVLTSREQNPQSGGWEP